MNQESIIISIKEARKILGVEYRDEPDSMVEAVINDLDFMAEILLKHLKINN